MGKKQTSDEKEAKLQTGQSSCACDGQLDWTHSRVFKLNWMYETEPQLDHRNVESALVCADQVTSLNTNSQ